MDEIQLNDPAETYKLYDVSPLREVIPQIVKDGRRLISIKELMERRLKAHEIARESWKNNSFYTNMCVLVHPGNGDNPINIKFVIDHPLIYSIKPDSELDVLKITMDDYNAKDGLIFTPQEAYEMRELPCSRHNKDIRHRFWRFASEGDEQLLREYEEMMGKDYDLHGSVYECSMRLFLCKNQYPGQGLRIGKVESMYSDAHIDEGFIYPDHFSNIVGKLGE
jgi:hypothetical protein